MKLEDMDDGILLLIEAAESEGEEREMREVKNEIAENMSEIQESPKIEMESDSQVRLEEANDIYSEVMEEYFKEREEGPDTQVFKDYYETIKEKYSDKSRDEVYEMLSDEYEFLEDYLHRPDEEKRISLYDYNETRCAEEYGDSNCDVDDDDDSNDPYYC